MKRSTALAALVVMLMILVAPMAGLASRAVKKTVTGCVQGAELVSDGYTFRVRSSAAAADTDLGPYEGLRIRVRGYLLPGDILVGERIDVVSGSCPMKR